MPASPARSFWRSPLSLLCLAVLCFLTLLFRLGSYGLVDADEGRYAEIPREMLARGDWVTPTLNGVKFFDKPVLLYWSVMAFYRTLGVSEFAARLAPVCFALAGIAATYALGRRAFGARAAWLGAAILTTTLMWPVMGRTVITDTPLAALTTCALAAWWLGHTTPVASQTQRNQTAPIAGVRNEASPIQRGQTRPDNRTRNFWFALFWVFVGLGVLAKGPVAGVLCFGAIVPYLLWCRPEHGWRMNWLGAPLMILIAAPWFVAVQGRNSEFNHLFWYGQNFQRFTGSAGVPDHWESWHYFLPFLPVIFFPWSVFFPRAFGRVLPVFRRARTEPDNQSARAVVFLVFGALFVLLFFSASKSKIVTYILPLVPLGCALLGAWFDARWTRGDRFKIEGAVLGFLALALGVCAFAFGSRVGKQLHLPSVPVWLLVSGEVTVLWALSLLIAAWRGKTREVFGATAGGFALLLASGLLFWSSVESQVTLRALMRPVAQVMTPDTQIASIGFIQSLSYYGAPNRILVNGMKGNTDKNKIPDELRPGWERMSQAERDAYFYGDASGLKRLLAHSNPVFVVARSRTLVDPQWRSIQAQTRVLASNARFTLYGNDAAARRFRHH